VTPDAFKSLGLCLRSNSLRGDFAGLPAVDPPPRPTFNHYRSAGVDASITNKLLTRWSEPDRKQIANTARKFK
jgi:hypothetical protein